VYDASRLPHPRGTALSDVAGDWGYGLDEKLHAGWIEPVALAACCRALRTVGFFDAQPLDMRLVNRHAPTAIVMAMCGSQKKALALTSREFLPADVPRSFEEVFDRTGSLMMSLLPEDAQPFEGNACNLMGYSGCSPAPE
jgi:hypothetical protein